MEAEREKNRIRDNQRRSRARKKEYVQDLEQRLRACQLQGIEASAEVQQAARRVADENQKLRKLLTRFGLGSDQVEHYLKTGNVNDAPGYSALAAPESSMKGHASTTLDGLLVPRRPAFLDHTKSLGSPSQQNSSLAYENGSNSPPESYCVDSEDAQQPHYDLDPPSSIPIAQQLSYGQTEDLRHLPLVSAAEPNRHDSRWPPGNPVQSSSGQAVNLQGYGANQALDFHPSFSGASPTSSLPPPPGRSQAAPEYMPYGSIYQQHGFPTQMGPGSAGHSGSASVSDVDSSANDQRHRQTGSAHEYPWIPADSTVRSHFNTHHG